VVGVVVGVRVMSSGVCWSFIGRCPSIRWSV